MENGGDIDSLIATSYLNLLTLQVEQIFISPAHTPILLMKQNAHPIKKNCSDPFFPHCQ